MAHVIAHALTGRDAATAGARLASLKESPDPNRRVLQLADILGEMMTSEPRGKEQEREVDAIALELMARAGLDPEPTVEAWRKIARAGGAAPPGFLSLHPTWPGRLEELEALTPGFCRCTSRRVRSRQPGRGRRPSGCGPAPTDRLHRDFESGVSGT